MEFSNKVVIVTGAGQGIGEAYAKCFAEQGAAVVVAELNEQQGGRVAEEITAAGGQAIFVKTDVSSPEDAAAVAGAAVNRFGGIDFLINNAAIFQGMKFESMLDVDLDYYYTIMRVNMHSPLIMSRAVVPAMEQRGGGVIINQSSTAAMMAQANYYGIAKLGVQGITICLARELGDRNIRVNAISPGPTDTEATRQMPADILAQTVESLAMKRLGSTDDIVNMALYLCSDKASWTTGQIYRVDGGATLFPI